MMSVDEKAREMARQYIPHEAGFSMGGLLIAVIEFFEKEEGKYIVANDTLRSERNAAQQRADQAERERDEARAVVDRVKDAVNELSFRGANSSNLRAAQGVMVSVNELRVALGETPDFEFDMSAEAQLNWTPQTGAEIAASLEGKPPILPSDFDIDRAPTVKADTPVQISLHDLMVRADHHWKSALEFPEKDGQAMRMAVGDILDILERLIKAQDGAS